MGKKKKRDPNLNRERSKERMTHMGPFSVEEIENMGPKGLRSLEASKAPLGPGGAQLLERKLLELELTGEPTPKKKKK